MHHSLGGLGLACEGSKAKPPPPILGTCRWGLKGSGAESLWDCYLRMRVIWGPYHTCRIAYLGSQATPASAGCVR